jgi:hypothetical protein
VSGTNLKTKQSSGSPVADIIAHDRFPPFAGTLFGVSKDLRCAECLHGRVVFGWLISRNGSLAGEKTTNELSFAFVTCKTRCCGVNTGFAQGICDAGQARKIDRGVDAEGSIVLHGCLFSPAKDRLCLCSQAFRAREACGILDPKLVYYLGVHSRMKDTGLLSFRNSGGGRFDASSFGEAISKPIPVPSARAFGRRVGKHAMWDADTIDARAKPEAQ